MGDTFLCHENNHLNRTVRTQTLFGQDANQERLVGLPAEPSPLQSECVSHCRGDAGHLQLDGACLCLYLPRRQRPYANNVTLLLYMYCLASPLPHTHTEKPSTPTTLPWLSIACLHNGTPHLMLGLAHEPQQFTGLLAVWAACLLSDSDRSFALLSSILALTASMWKENPSWFHSVSCFLLKA